MDRMDCPKSLSCACKYRCRDEQEPRKPTARDAERAMAIEQAAKVAESFRDGNPQAWDSIATTGRRIAAAIRALAGN